MAYISILGNELRKIDIFKDNAVQLTLNLGEIPDEVIQALYAIKKKGEFKVMIANIDDWADAITVEATVQLGIT